MPFGISSAPEEFRRRFHEITAGLAGVEVIADDILIYGAGDTDEQASADHDQNLISLLQHAKENNLKFKKVKVTSKICSLHGTFTHFSGFKTRSF